MLTEIFVTKFEVHLTIRHQIMTLVMKTRFPILWPWLTLGL